MKSLIMVIELGQRWKEKLKRMIHNSLIIDSKMSIFFFFFDIFNANNN